MLHLRPLQSRVFQLHACIFELGRSLVDVGDGDGPAVNAILGDALRFQEGREGALKQVDLGVETAQQEPVSGEFRLQGQRAVSRSPALAWAELRADATLSRSTQVEGT